MYSEELPAGGWCRTSGRPAKTSRQRLWSTGASVSRQQPLRVEALGRGTVARALVPVAGAALPAGLPDTAVAIQCSKSPPGLHAFQTSHPDRGYFFAFAALGEHPNILEDIELIRRACLRFSVSTEK
jgi:hypothetical protein